LARIFPRTIPDIRVVRATGDTYSISGEVKRIGRCGLGSVLDHRRDADPVRPRWQRNGEAADRDRPLLKNKEKAGNPKTTNSPMPCHRGG